MVAWGRRQIEEFRKHPGYIWKHLLYWRTYPREYMSLRWARARYGTFYIQADPAPLISIVIPTWNRGKLLVERTIPSVLRQTYQNFEVVIVGDHCTDDTQEQVARFRDPRLKFWNLPARGRYPETPEACWQVAGTSPANMALKLARGKWISYIDDDDVYTEDHLEVLLRFAQQRQLEFVYAAAERELASGQWVCLRETPEKRAFDVCNDMGVWGHGIGHSTWFYRSYLRCFRYDMQAWRYNIPGDKSVMMRMGRAGVRAGYLDRVVAYMPLRPGDTVFSQLRVTPIAEWKQENVS